MCVRVRKISKYKNRVFLDWRVPHCRIEYICICVFCYIDLGTRIFFRKEFGGRLSRKEIKLCKQIEESFSFRSAHSTNNNHSSNIVGNNLPGPRNDEGYFIEIMMMSLPVS